MAREFEHISRTLRRSNADARLSISWSGGGDIITDDDFSKGWTMDTLKDVAIAFTDKVAACSQRTSAILTKYANLRRFYEESLHGSPLNDEIAGAYSSALLDAYMDYKTIGKTRNTCPGRSTVASPFSRSSPLMLKSKAISLQPKASFDE